MIALTRFQVAGYVRSLRVLQPAIVVFLFITVILLQGPWGDPDAAVGTLGDVAAFMFPVWAWTARGLLDTQPDEQRALSSLAVARSGVAGLLAAYTVNVALGGVAFALPVVQALTSGIGSAAFLSEIGLFLLVALAGTALGAWASRAILPHAGVSLLALIGGIAAAMLLGLGPLSWLAIPILEWLRAAHDGPSAFADTFPEVALHLGIWTAVVVFGYLAFGRRRV